MIDRPIPRDALILIGDGARALFLRNRGAPPEIDLAVERVLEQDNPATREQGTDRPGRAIASVGARRSAMQQTDWHKLAEERFAEEIAGALRRAAEANRFEALVVIAPAKILGDLRKCFHKTVADRVIAEAAKDLVSHPLPEIERLLAA